MIPFYFPVSKRTNKGLFTIFRATIFQHNDPKQSIFNENYINVSSHNKRKNIILLGDKTHMTMKLFKVYTEP